MRMSIYIYIERYVRWYRVKSIIVSNNIIVAPCLREPPCSPKSARKKTLRCACQMEMCLDIAWVWPYQEFRVVLQQEGPPWSNGNSESHSHKLLDTTTITITINIIISSDQMIVSGRPCFDVSIGFWLSSGLMKSSSAFEHPIGRALMVHGPFWHSVIALQIPSFCI